MNEKNLKDVNLYSLIVLVIKLGMFSRQRKILNLNYMTPGLNSKPCIHLQLSLILITKP
jgi:hypothetical protein